MSKMYKPLAGSFVCGTVGGGAACRSIADVAFRAEFVRTQIGLSGGKTPAEVERCTLSPFF